MTACENRTAQEQVAIADELSSLSWRYPGVHQLLTGPVREFLGEVLERWVSDEPKDPRPLKWLGHLRHDADCFERALALDPTDEVCIGSVARGLVFDLDHQTHHLSESSFIGDLEEAKANLQRAQSLTATLSTGAIKTQLQADLDDFSCLLECWEQYSALGTNEPFPKWCKSRGEDFNFWSIVYYDA